MDSRNETVDALRGLCALGVCLFHASWNTQHSPDPFWTALLSVGTLRVDVFFMISGFIIPFALTRAGYVLEDFPRFLLKRLIRLEPTYLASLAFTVPVLLLAAYSPWYKGPPLHLTTGNLVCHIGYLCGVLYPERGLSAWLGAYWPLAIDMQFYVLIGLLLPLFSSKIGPTAVAAFAIVPFVYPANGIWLSGYLGLFAVGIAIFQFKVGRVDRKALYCLLIGLAFCVSVQRGPTSAIGVLLAGILIAEWAAPRVKWLAFLGAISYSLFLVHFPIVTKISNIVVRFDKSVVGETVALCLGTALSIVAAWLMWRFVDRPVARLSRRIRYTGKPQPAWGDYSLGSRLT